MLTIYCVDLLPTPLARANWRAYNNVFFYSSLAMDNWTLGSGLIGVGLVGGKQSSSSSSPRVLERRHLLSMLVAERDTILDIQLYPDPSLECMDHFMRCSLDGFWLRSTRYQRCALCNILSVTILT